MKKQLLENKFIFNELKHNLINDLNFINLFDEIFDTDFKLKDKNYNDKIKTIKNIILYHNSRAISLKVLIFAYLAKSTQLKNIELMDEMWGKGKIKKIYEKIFMN